MRTRLLALAALLALVAGGLVLLLGDGDERRGPISAEERLEEAREIAAPSDVMLARQLLGSDLGGADRIAQRARRQARTLAAKTAQSSPVTAATKWQFVGPTNIGGRILDLVVDPAQANTIFVAAASGGIWKSTDAGRRFSPAWPLDATQAFGALAMSPTGILYAGTGETGPGGGSLTFAGTGLYRSTDRGKTWTRIGLQDSSRISRIVIDPSDERRIFVAASGPLFKPGGERGLFLSTDAGASWKRVLEGENPTTGAVDIAVDPRNPRRVFAAMWDHLRTPNVRRYAGSGSGLYRSDDGGQTWARIGSPFFGPHPAIGRLGVAIAPSDPDIVYVNSSALDGRHAGFFKSTDGGDTFIPLPGLIPATAQTTYAWWFGRVWVDPKDADHIFAADVPLMESRDGGLSWAADYSVHVDHHAMAWDPKVADRVYLGNDGGVYRSADNGASWDFADYQPWSQLYGLDVGEQDPRQIVAGLQDNGSILTEKGNDRDWGPIYGGDGTRTRINPRDRDNIFACAQNGACVVSYDGGQTREDISNKVISTRKNWFTPIEFDPENPDVVFSGGEIMSRSTDKGRTWIPISRDLSKGPGSTDPNYPNYGTLTTIAPAPARTGTIYAGTDDGNVVYTHDSGSTWTRSTDADLPNAWVTRVEVDPRNPKVAYVTFSGFRQGEDAAYILKTTDGGESWTDITGNLPAAPLNDVNAIDDDLVVASDLGVFASRDGGRSWLKLGSDLPLAPVFELRYHAPTRTVYVATFGRGVWRISIDALTAAPRPAARPTLGLPSRRSCRTPTEMRFRLRAPAGKRLRAATVFVNGRRAATLRGRALRRPVRLRRLPRGAVRVRVAATTTRGERVSAQRRYGACPRGRSR
jgi:photosystem II stability/assembly factor-like uncharacterized protein